MRERARRYRGLGVMPGTMRRLASVAPVLASISAVVSAVVSAVMASADAMGDDGCGADDRGGAGDRGTDDTAAGAAGGS